LLQKTGYTAADKKKKKKTIIIKHMNARVGGLSLHKTVTKITCQTSRIAEKPF